MKTNSIDTVLEVRLRHEPGTLARLAELVPSPLGRELHEAIAAGVVKHPRKSGMAGTAS